MTGRNKIVIALRVISIIIGGAILAWYGNMYVRVITLYGPEVNFWYFTGNSMTNFGYALLAYFAFFVLVGVAAYPGKTPVSFLLILTGAVCIAVGQALMVNLGFWFYFAMNGPLGIVLTLVGVMALILGAFVEIRFGKAKRSTPQIDTVLSLE